MCVQFFQQSRRWCSLWTQVVSIDCSPFVQTPNFYTIVDHFLSQLTSPRINDFILCIPNSEQGPVSPNIESWLRLVCARNVQRMRLLTTKEGESDSDCWQLVTAPACVFQTQSLSLLDLYYKLPDEVVTKNMRIDLPNLKTLKLRLCASQCGFVARVTRSCQSLKNLILNGVGSWERKHEGDDFVIDISSRSLKELDLRFVLAPETTKILIDAPKLRYFVLVASRLTCSFQRKHIALHQAAIFTCNPDLMQSLLPVISHVSVLETLPISLSALKGLHKQALTFRNLTFLKLYFGFSISTDNDNFLRLILDPPPACLLLHVKRIEVEISGFKLGKHMLNLAKYMLSNARVLEWLVFLRAKSQSECTLDEELEELEFCSELYGYPRCSPRCQIEFFRRQY